MTVEHSLLIRFSHDAANSLGSPCFLPFKSRRQYTVYCAVYFCVVQLKLCFFDGQALIDGALVYLIMFKRLLNT